MKLSRIRFVYATLLAVLVLLAACSDTSAPGVKSDAWTSQAGLEVMALQSVGRDDLSGARRSTTTFTLNVPAGASDLAITTSGGTGDVDLYVNLGRRASGRDFDCRSNGFDNEESCIFESPEAGQYFVTLFGYAAYDGVSLQATFDDGTAPEPAPDTSDIDVEDILLNDFAPSSSFRDFEATSGDSTTVTIRLSSPAPAGGIDVTVFNGTNYVFDDLEGTLASNGVPFFVTTVPAGVQDYTLPFTLITAPIDREVPITGEINAFTDSVVSRVEKEVEVSRAANTQSFLAENTNLGGAAQVVGFSFIDIDNLAAGFPVGQSSSLSLDINVEQAGTYLLGINYGVEFDVERAATSVSVNGSQSSSFTLLATGSATTLDTQVRLVEVDLNAGANTIEVASPDGGFSVDKLNVIPFN